MSDESQLQILPKVGDSPLSPSKVRTGLIARGCKDAAILTAALDAKSAVHRSTLHLWVSFGFDGRSRDEVLKDGENGDAKLQNLIACNYLHGSDGDLAEAARWYRKAVDQGLREAQFNLGLMYDNGKGVEQDLAVVAKWYRQAANQGLKEAQFNLGVMYDVGEGVPRDYAVAASWHREAAGQGLDTAKFNLGVMYDNGKGMARDLAEAPSGTERQRTRVFIKRSSTSGRNTSRDKECRRMIFRRISGCISGRATLVLMMKNGVRQCATESLLD